MPIYPESVEQRADGFRLTADLNGCRYHDMVLGECVWGIISAELSPSTETMETECIR